MARQVTGRAIIGAVLVLLIVVGGIFVLVAVLIGDKTKNQEHSAPPVPISVRAQPLSAGSGAAPSANRSGR